LIAQVTQIKSAENSLLGSCISTGSAHEAGSGNVELREMLLPMPFIQNSHSVAFLMSVTGKGALPSRGYPLLNTANYPVAIDC